MGIMGIMGIMELLELQVNNPRERMQCGAVDLSRETGSVLSLTWDADSVRKSRIIAWMKKNTRVR
jgi:hypothetical protein